MLAALIGLWIYRRSGMAQGYVVFIFHCFHQRLTFYPSTIRLPGGENRSYYQSSSGIIDTLASVPYFLIGLGGIAWEWVSSKFDSATSGYRTSRGYRNIPVDEDAQVLRFEDEE